MVYNLLIFSGCRRQTLFVGNKKNLHPDQSGFYLLSDGQDALAKLTGQKVHLLVCDVNMPNMDGISFVRELKQLPAYKFAPVLMFTTESEESKQHEGRAAGARGWIQKPCRPQHVLSAVRKLVLP